MQKTEGPRYSVSKGLTRESCRWISPGTYLREGELPSGRNCTAVYVLTLSFRSESMGPCYSWCAERLGQTWPLPSVINRANRDAVRNAHRSSDVERWSKFDALAALGMCQCVLDTLSVQKSSVVASYWFTACRMFLHVYMSVSTDGAWVSREQGLCIFPLGAPTLKQGIFHNKYCVSAFGFWRTKDDPIPQSYVV